MCRDLQQQFHQPGHIAGREHPAVDPFTTKFRSGANHVASDNSQTGRGSFQIRARASTEYLGRDRQSIVVTEIPYQVNKTTLINRIVECVKDDRLTGIGDVSDESDKEGMRLIVELKKGEDPEIILNQLFKHTQLRDTFSINSIALVGGKPQLLNLKEFLVHFRDHRIEVIRRRIQFLLEKAQRRAHILEGLQIAIDNIDAV
ncbi:MAG: hypothetical protein IH831_06270, partial [Planctomycetes bacterium]|nr:hypothetical protein [Planctomycetota bacterium]